MDYSGKILMGGNIDEYIYIQFNDLFCERYLGMSGLDLCSDIDMRHEFDHLGCDMVDDYYMIGTYDEDLFIQFFQYLIDEYGGGKLDINSKFNRFLLLSCNETSRKYVNRFLGESKKIKRNKSLYESIMKNVSELVKKALNEQVYPIYDRNIQYVKYWYMSKYPEDDLGQELNQELMFSTLWKYMQMGCDIYTLIGVGDSIVRERIMGEIARRLNVEYDDIYDTWLRKQVKLSDKDFEIDNIE